MRDTYKTNDGQALFEFDFIQNRDSTYTVHIIRSPSYGSRSTNGHVIHRNGDNTICFGNPSEVNTLDKARKYSETWSEMTWKYIQTGVKFEDQNPKEMGWGTRLAISAALAALGIPFIG